jgi:hypothetical protein
VHNGWIVFDNEHQANRVMDFDHLDGQTRAQVSIGAICHTQEAYYVVRQLGACPQALWIHARKVVFQIDASANGANRPQNTREQGAIRVLRVVVRVQEGSTVQEEVLRMCTLANDAQGVGRVVVLGAGLKNGG